MSMKWLTAKSNSLVSKQKLLLVMIAMLVMVTAGCGLLPDENEEELITITPPKISEKPIYEVKSETIESKVRGVGKLMSNVEEILFFTQDNMRVKDVYVKSGTPVSGGLVLAELDATDLERQLRTKELQFRKDELQMIEILRIADEMEPEELEQAKIDFELKRNELVDLRESIAETKLTAPFSGTVVAMNIQKGGTSKAYEVAAIVADLDQLTVAASISADDLNKIVVGMDAVVNINTIGEFKGKVVQLPIPKDSNNNGSEQDTIDNYLIIEIDGLPADISRGTPLSVSVITQRKENATVIPPAALRTHAGRTYVQVVDKDGNKREVDVEVGQQTSTSVEIIKGLSPGQKVVGR